MVGTDNRPEMSVGINDNFQNLLEEMPASEAYNMGIGIGIIGGILIGIFLCLLLVMAFYYFQKNTEEIELEEHQAPEVTKEKKITKYIVYLLIITMLFGTIGGMLYTDSYFKKDYEISESENDKQTSTPKYRNAKNKDIITNVNNMTLSIQASEKIEGLVVKVNYLDKDKNILKTENVNVGNIAPGNTFQHTLTKSGIQVPDLDKLKSVTVEVIDGTIEE